MNIDWKQKLSSRKFWAALAAVITCLLTVFGVPDLQKEHIQALLLAVGTLAAYILGESAVDRARLQHVDSKKVGVSDEGNRRIEVSGSDRLGESKSGGD